MADVSVTDSLSLSADIAINDDSGFALSQLSKLNFTNVPIVGDFTKPIDRCSFQQASFGAGLTSPGMLLGNNQALTVSGGGNGTLFVCNEKSATLFENDGCAPDICITQGQCWIGLELATCMGAQLAATVDGFGVAVARNDEIRFATYVLFTSAPNPLPTLQQALKTLLQNYSIAANANAIRQQPAGTVRTVGTKGDACISASYSLPLTIDPLAQVGLPFQYQLAFQPSASVQLTGSISLTGEFVVRSYRESAETLIFGLYKKKATTFAAAFTANAGIGADVGGKDLLAPVLKAVLPGASLQSLKLDPDQTQQLQTAFNCCVDQSLAVALNARCSASVADEAALIYSIDLTQEIDQTNKAIAAALRGDWSAFEGLPTAKPIRSVIREVHDQKHQLNINLLGILNTTSISDYFRSSTVLQDGSGRIVLIDREDAKTLSATGSNYAAKPEKLRSLLAQAFLTTVSYSASLGTANPKLAMKSFAVRQSYLDYKAKASAQELRQYILLARSLGLAVNNAWDAILQSSADFSHAKCCVDAQYAMADVMRIFYADPATRQPRSRLEVDKIGRNAKLSLLDLSADNAPARQMALSSDAIWDAMCTNGNTVRFNSIEGLAGLPETAIGAISADWIDIRWWSNAMQQIPAKLTGVLQALDSSTTANATEDANFMERHKELQTVLANLTANTQSAFGDGWGMAVIHRCAAGAPFTQIDIGWNNEFQHWETGSQSVAGASGGS